MASAVETPEAPLTTQEPRPSIPAPADDPRPHVVIVGGGFGGLSAARALKRAPVRVTLIDRVNHHLFQPLLYQVATAGLSPGEIASPIRWILRRQGNVHVLLGEVLRIDPVRRLVVADFGEIAYDYVVVATGSTHAYFGHDEWQARAPGLKTLDDALRIRREILLAFEQAERILQAPSSVPSEARDAEVRRLLTFVIVGGGPTGVELAGAVAEIARHSLRHEFRAIRPEQAQVLLLEGGPIILATFPEDLRGRALRDLERLGVTVRVNTIVTGIEPGVVVAGSERIPCGPVLWAAGVAASALGRSFARQTDRVGRVPVEPDLSVAGHPELFVIGDLALFTHQGGKPLPGVAPVAMQQAAHAAANVRADLAGRPRKPFHYRDLGNLATIGRASAIADFGRIHLTGWLAWIVWLFVHIMELIGFRNRLVVLLQWAWAYFTRQRSIRLITGTSSSAGS